MLTGGRKDLRVYAVIVVLIALALVPASTAFGLPVAEAGPEVRDFTGRPVVFEGIGTPDATLRIILYEWDFEGDGTYDWNSTRSGMSTHRFWETGEFNATLRVTQYNASDGGELLTDTDTTTVTIRSGEPVGSITSGTMAQVDTGHRLKADFYDPDGGILEYVWRVEGALESNDDSFKHTFKALGRVNVTLTVTDDEGEQVVEQVIINVVEEVPSGEDDQTMVLLAGVIVGLAVIGVVAYVGILRSHKRTDKHPLTYDELSHDDTQIVSEASLTEDQPVPEPRKKPRVVRPERVVLATNKTKEKAAHVPAAPARLPCPECGTTLSEEGRCPFCDANEAIDAVERSIRDLLEDGYILAKADEELEAAKNELHVKNFDGVEDHLETANDLMEEAVREHERCLTLMSLVEDLILEAKDRDLDVTKAGNLLKLSKSFMKSGKYPKAIFYAERSRDFLLDKLEPFDLDRYFCEHCKGEVDKEDAMCPYCDEQIESGLIRRAKRELIELKRRFEGISRDHTQHTPIAAQIEKADEHVESRSASAAHEHIEQAREMMDKAETGPDGEADQGPSEATEEEDTEGPGEEAAEEPEEEATKEPEEEATEEPEEEATEEPEEEASADSLEEAPEEAEDEPVPDGEDGDSDEQRDA
jgi:PKD repeat protein